MASVNKASIVGNLGKDPEVRYTQSGAPVCNFSVATTETWFDQENQKQERTDWHNIVVWGKQAEACGKYLAKGRACYIEGRIQTRNYDAQDGTKRYVTEIVAQRVQFLGGRDNGQQQQHNGSDYEQSGRPPEPDNEQWPDDDNVPF